MSKIPQSLQTQFRKSAITICPITGISLSIEIPSLPLVFDYKNPLANFKHARDFAKLPLETLSSQSPTILAGVLLTFLNHYKLIEDKLSSSERNAILAKLHSSILIRGISFFSSISHKEIHLLPHLSLSEFISASDTCQSVLLSYISTCRQSLGLAETLISDPSRSYYRSMNVSKKGTTKLLTVTQETKTSLRSAILSLKISEQISDKFFQTLTTLSVGQTLYMIAPEVREKIITKLSLIEGEASQEIIKILKSTDKASLALIQNKVNESLDRFSSDIPRKKTLKEILAEKISGRSERSEEVCNSSSTANTCSDQQDDKTSEEKEEKEDLLSLFEEALIEVESEDSEWN